MMGRLGRISVPAAAVLATVFAALPGGQHALAQSPRTPRGGQVIAPDSSVEQPGDIGVRAHTNIKYFVPTGGMGSVRPPAIKNGAQPSGAPVPETYWAETPASLACVYRLARTSTGCNPYVATAVPKGGTKAIAIVDAYHYPTAAADLGTFSTQFGLPPANLHVVFASGSQPPVNSDWNIEEALDIQWAHAMAPDATIYLVEAQSNNLGDLLAAVNVANGLLANAGGGEVSMSWGSSEFSSEVSYDSHFTANGVVYFASAGDGAGVTWPSASPNVVSVGGTANSRFVVARGTKSAGDFEGELAWQDTGGGPSAYEPPPPYQAGFGSPTRLTPDVAAIADPNTPVYVYKQGWYLVGGTSVSAPVWAGIVNRAGTFSSNSQAEQSLIAGGRGVKEVKNGACGPHLSYWIKKGHDLCTGLGTPKNVTDK